MKKICQPSPPLRKRRTVSRRPADKVGKLEMKLDGLVALLTSTTSSTPANLNAISVNSTIEDSPTYSVNESPAVNDDRYGGHDLNKPLDTGHDPLDSVLTPAASSSSDQVLNSLPFSLHSALLPSPDDAESYLETFRTEMLEHLPFVAISPLTTAHQLRQESPFLWLSVMTVASNRSSQQIALSKRVREIFGLEAFLEGTRSIDLLLAVLIYAAW